MCTSLSLSLSIYMHFRFLWDAYKVDRPCIKMYFGGGGGFLPQYRVGVFFCPAPQFTNSNTPPRLLRIPLPMIIVLGMSL